MVRLFNRADFPQHIQADDEFWDPREGPDNAPVALSTFITASMCLDAYSKGIFPWNSFDAVIWWWCPGPRGLLFPPAFHASRSLRKWCRHQTPMITVDACFDEVMRQCAKSRMGREKTWITGPFVKAFTELHRQKYAHSVEVWISNELMGGIYGVCIGQQFYGESMFSKSTNGSKVALWALCWLLDRWKFDFLDCQISTPHLESLGCIEVERDEYLNSVQVNALRAQQPELWKVAPFSSSELLTA